MKVRNIIVTWATTVVLAVGTVSATLSAITDVNGSFETGNVIPTDGYVTLDQGNDTSISNWEVTKGSVDYIDGFWEAADGTRSIDLSGNEAGALSQTLVTIPGHTYIVNFDLAGNPDGGPDMKNLTVDTGGLPTTYFFDTTGQDKEDMGWEERNYTFKAAGTSAVLTFTSLVNSPFGPVLDNVRITDVLTDKNQCKNGGWTSFTDPTFINQGDCVSYIQSSPNAAAAKLKQD